MKIPLSPVIVCIAALGAWSSPKAPGAPLAIAYVDVSAPANGDDSPGNHVFGTIHAALEAVDYAGRVVIRSSGVFHEALHLRSTTQAAPVTLVIEAPPGVTAVLDAYDDAEAPTSAANRGRFAQTAVDIVNPDGTVILRNLVVRNWTTGVSLTGRGYNDAVLLEDCRIENCFDYGVRGQGFGRVVARRCTILQTGFQSYLLGRLVDPKGVSLQTEGNVAGFYYDNTLLGALRGIKAKGALAKGALTQSNNLVADYFGNILTTQ